MLVPIAILALTATSSWASPERLPTAGEVSHAAALCMVAAGKQGVDVTRFQTAGWKAESSGPTAFHHSTLPVAVETPADKDGVARTCVVRAQLTSQGEQKKLAASISDLLRAKPVDQGNSLIWLVSTKTGPRGIQLYLDKNADQPSVRLIGAAF